MHKLRQIFAFVAPYVKPYWGRVVAGVFFGILFGASNGLVLWATKTMLDRLVPPEESEQLFASAGEPKKLVVLKGVGHYEVYAEPAFSEVMQETLAWYQAYLPAKS